MYRINTQRNDFDQVFFVFLFVLFRKPSSKREEAFVF